MNLAKAAIWQSASVFEPGLQGPQRTSSWHKNLSATELRFLLFFIGLALQKTGTRAHFFPDVPLLKSKEVALLHNSYSVHSCLQGQHMMSTHLYPHGCALRCFTAASHRCITFSSLDVEESSTALHPATLPLIPCFLQGRASVIVFAGRKPKPTLTNLNKINLLKDVEELPESPGGPGNQAWKLYHQELHPKPGLQTSSR